VGVAKLRLDQLLVDRGLAASRERAQRLIQAGVVLVGGQKLDKPGAKVDAEAELRLLEPDHPFASRGGLKLEGVLDGFSVRVQGCVAADLGASTGGFTDCLLQRGAVRVHAVDVGYGLLDWRLRQDPRVHVVERTNVRHLTVEQLGEPVDLVVADLAFISLRLVLPAVLGILRPGGEAVLLVKPQFELGRQHVGKGGIVRDERLRQDAVDAVERSAVQLGFQALGRLPSTVPGQKGNLEIFLHLRAPGERGEVP
jgi:23S rRNA (cytidine1920-2'-O)/16S rRNA (cytidine1409-2'-O)-methyltransferase